MQWCVTKSFPCLLSWWAAHLHSGGSVEGAVDWVTDGLTDARRAAGSISTLALTGLTYCKWHLLPVCLLAKADRKYSCKFSHYHSVNAHFLPIAIFNVIDPVSARPALWLNLDDIRTQTDRRVTNRAAWIDAMLFSWLWRESLVVSVMSA